jgi:ribonuclease BN (tRNA processing enzyme)
MNLVVLGSGTSVPHPQRASAGFWLEAEAGSLLLDCGADTPHRLAAENLDWPNLDAIWISHLHLDHCGGLASFLFGTRHAPQTQERRKPLTIFGCRGTRELLYAIDGANNSRLFDQPFPVELREVTAEDEFEIVPDLHARVFSTRHTEESLAIRVSDHSGSALVYSSDTGYDEGLVEFARGVDLLILECSFWRDKPTLRHLELAEAMRLARMAGPLKVVLTHLYSEWDGVDLESRARELWPGETIAAYDGLRLKITQVD